MNHYNQSAALSSNDPVLIEWIDYQRSNKCQQKPMTNDQINITFKKIHYEEKTIEINYDRLSELFLSFVQGIPFSNQAIHLTKKKPVDLHLEEIYHRLVVQGVGGCCYEIAGLFNWLLISLGYSAHLIPTSHNRNRETDPHNPLMNDGDSHAINFIRLPNKDINDKHHHSIYFLEIGVGTVAKPLLFEYNIEQTGLDGLKYRFTQGANQDQQFSYYEIYDSKINHWVVRGRLYTADVDYMRNSDNIPQYQLPHSFLFSLARCYYPCSIHQQTPLIYKLSNAGKTVCAMRFNTYTETTRENGQVIERKEVEMEDFTQWRAQLKKIFGIEYPENLWDASFFDVQAYSNFNSQFIIDAKAIAEYHIPQLTKAVRYHYNNIDK
jgi:arylamine N-acetyltransferase